VPVLNGEQLQLALERFNLAIWPAQMVAFALGGAALMLVLRGGRRASLGTAAILAGFWLAVAAFEAFWLPAPGGPALAALSVVQAAVLCAEALRGRLVFGLPTRAAGAVGLGLVACALVAYPAVAALADLEFPRVPPFGLAPGPVALFTFGLLVLTVRPVRARAMVVPLLTAAACTGAAASGLAPEWTLLPAALAAVAALGIRSRRRAQTLHAHRRAGANLT